MKKPIVLYTITELLKHISLEENRHISFHHHLRNGDFVVNQILQLYETENIQNIHIHPSSIFPSYTKILDLLKTGQITDITTSYINGDVAKYISENGLKGTLRMTSHGGRARGILEGKEKINIAYIAAPYVDKNGNSVGYKGKNRCGSLGYAIADSLSAETVILVTDNMVDEIIDNPEIKGTDVDYILVVEAIGNPKGIVSGTTTITNNPVGVKIAKKTSEVMNHLDIIKDGFSYQSGAGGTSLLVTEYLKEKMIKESIKASFFSGGITKYHVEALENKLVDKLYDVQCFDLEAIESLGKNENHIPISASRYANPKNENNVIQELDIVILGAAEIDLNFNVNVTTDSYNNIIGGSGGHTDVSEAAKITIIVSPLLKGRVPIIKDKVNTITTPGKWIDILVTERGISINPLRTDIIDKIKNTNLKIYSIKELQDMAHHFTGVPKAIPKGEKIIGKIVNRNYDIIDMIYQKIGD